MAKHFKLLFLLLQVLLSAPCLRSQHVGTCFLSPFQLPAAPTSEFRTAGKTTFRSTSAHANAPQVPPNTPSITSEDKRQTGNSGSSQQTTSQVKETTDRNLDEFLFPGEKRPSIPIPVPKSRPPPTIGTKGTDTRSRIPSRRPPPAPATTKSNTGFLFPGERRPAVRTTDAPVVQQREQSIIRRPASRIFSEELFFAPENQLVNWEELEAISQFEAALEEAKREGLYGLRTRSRARTTTRPSITAPDSGHWGSGHRDQGFFESNDFSETYDPLASAPVARPENRRKQLSDDGPSVPPPPPLAQVLRQRETGGRFYEWLERSSFLRNMRIAPGTNFTVLLPNDEAIADLPDGFVRDLESNVTRMREILFYHIIPESLGVDALHGEDMIPTLLRKKDIRVTKDSASDWLMMSGAKVLRERTDLEVDGGKVRFIQIDRLLMPPRGTLFDLMAGAPGLSVFTTLIQRTGLQSELQQHVNSAANGLTVFAPTDSAFSLVDDATVAVLTRDVSATRSFLLNHVSKPVVFASAIPAGAATVVKNIGSQDEVRIERRSEQLVQVNGVTVSFADVLATNGVLHVIERVLL